MTWTDQLETTNFKIKSGIRGRRGQPNVMMNLRTIEATLTGVSPLGAS